MTFWSHIAQNLISQELYYIEGVDLRWHTLGREWEIEQLSWYSNRVASLYDYVIFYT